MRRVIAFVAIFAVGCIADPESEESIGIAEQEWGIFSSDTWYCKGFDDYGALAPMAVSATDAGNALVTYGFRHSTEVRPMSLAHVPLYSFGCSENSIPAWECGVLRYSAGSIMALQGAEKVRAALCVASGSCWIDTMPVERFYAPDEKTARELTLGLWASRGIPTDGIAQTLECDWHHPVDEHWTCHPSGEPYRTCTTWAWSNGFASDQCLAACQGGIVPSNGKRPVCIGDWSSVARQASPGHPSPICEISRPAEYPYVCHIRMQVVGWDIVEVKEWKGSAANQTAAIWKAIKYWEDRTVDGVFHWKYIAPGNCQLHVQQLPGGASGLPFDW